VLDKVQQGFEDASDLSLTALRACMSLAACLTG
jgi:hypothetical protein